MRAIILLVLLATAAGVYFLGGNRIRNADVELLYAASRQAVHDLDDEALCAMLSEDFEQVLTIDMESQQGREEADRQAYCESYREVFAALRPMRERAGNRPLADYQYTINRIEIAPDGSSATVDTRSVNLIPGIRTTSRTTDTLVRRRWKTRVVRSEGKAWAGPAY
ncbi:MAG: nuclear transport factor 2 family protein [Pseudoxanthomonas sp.]|nr:nuclear transport factor 2 family protein [Pseudoxanthomonas sp.]